MFCFTTGQSIQCVFRMKIVKMIHFLSFYCNCIQRVWATSVRSNMEWVNQKECHQQTIYSGTQPIIQSRFTKYNLTNNESKIENTTLLSDPYNHKTPKLFQGIVRIGPAHHRLPISLGLMLLAADLYEESQRGDLPPVTMSAIVAQTVIYLQLIPVPWESNQACVSTYKILHKHDYWKLLIAQIEHADDLHLYYNMASFMWKGKSLERRIGSTKFALLLIMFAGSTGITYVGLNYALSELLQDESYMHRCAVGFSGVIFALKVLTTHYDYDEEDMMIEGIPINPKYAVWLELILISMITPNASFTGHLAGILVGLAYVYGPLKPMLDFVHDLVFDNGPFETTKELNYGAGSVF